MDQSILDQLYFGKVVPWENFRGNTPETEHMLDQADKDIQWLKKTLGDDGQKVLERFLKTSEDLERRMVCEGFKEGFRLGMQLAVAGLGSGKQP